MNRERVHPSRSVHGIDVVGGPDHSCLRLGICKKREILLLETIDVVKVNGHVLMGIIRNLNNPRLKGTRAASLQSGKELRDESEVCKMIDAEVAFESVPCQGFRSFIDP